MVNLIPITRGVKVKIIVRLVGVVSALFVVTHLDDPIRAIVIVVVKVLFACDVIYCTLLPITSVYLKKRDLLPTGKVMHWLAFV